MITDLFSHKIHSSTNDWPDRLVELACLFSEFDGEPYNRELIQQRLLQISPRSSYAPRDPSKFRDEISAYPAYLGLYYFEQSPNGWIMHLSETTREFLLREEPDVAAFLRLQLSLFQYPNGMGAAYYPGSNRIRIQANAKDRTLAIISAGIHISPIRLISKALLADSQIKSVDLFQAVVNYDEIYGLSNCPDTNRSSNPSLVQVETTLRNIRSGYIPVPESYERRFHILRHTGLFDVGQQAIHYRAPVSEIDEIDLRNKIEVLTGLDIQFSGFDSAYSGNDLEEVISNGYWGTYFDALRTLPADTVRVLGTDILESISITTPPPTAPPVTAPVAYDLREREIYAAVPSRSTPSIEYADPEVTKIKRQRRNLLHKILVDQMDQRLRSMGAAPMDSPHIDLFANIPQDGSFLFEMKSGGENFLDQIRKGISQLYEYRFRYGNSLGQDVNLCLVTPAEPSTPSWLIEYVCIDRDINLCWFESDGSLRYPEYCASKMALINANY